MVAAALLAGASAHGADWGTVKGKFVYKGAAKNDPITVTKDPEYCGKHNPVDETIMLGDDGALQNVFVYLYVERGKKAAIHPDYKPSAEPRVLDNHFCRFEPHALTVWTEEEFEVRNNDQGLGHNTNFHLPANGDFNLTVPNDAPIKRKFTKTESFPLGVTCNIHPWMHATVLVRDNPYMAVTGKDGAFEIKNVPAGNQEFVLWHEAKGYMRDLKVGSGKADRKGQIKVKVPAGGEVDLGTILVPPDILGK